MSRSLTVAAFLLVAPAAGAQRLAGTLVAGDGSHTVHVDADSAHLRLTAGGRAEPTLGVSMPAGTFTLRSDSATLASWVDQAETLAPAPRIRVRGSESSLPGVLLRSSGTAAANAMRLVRLPGTTPGDTGAPYMLEATNGAWVGSTVLAPAAFRALADALHGRDGNGGTPHTDSVYLEFQVDRPAQQLRLGNAPEYPEALRRARIGGEVQMQFVVGVDGRARPESVQLLKTTAPEFARAVREALPTYRYSPAMVGGRLVAMVVQQSFQFELR